MITLNNLWTNVRTRMVLLLLALVGAALVAGACGGGEKTTTTGSAQKVTVKIQDNTFETNWIENAIVKFIVEKGYGHQVEEVVLNTVAGQTALQKGDIDVNIELWPGNFQDWYNEEIAKGTIVKLGDIYGGGDQFWVIPQWVSEQYKVKTVEDMKRPEVVKLFEDPEDPKKGAFFNCIIGWQCQAINAAKLNTYGLDTFYNVVEPGSAAALDVALVGAMKKKQPVFGYYWAPTSIYGAYEWHILEEPTWTKECWDEVLKGRDAIAKGDAAYTAKLACAYETQPTEVVVSKRFAEEGPPELVDFFKKINVGTAQVSQTAAWAVENDIQGEWDKAAIYYLKTYEDRWTTWMPADKVQKVKEALQTAS
ncbi:MAG: hypothetical protein HYU30_02095 [Chloroflexi bacterium]|nr:hypothetical protein [Chloroflexota bacterium]